MTTHDQLAEVELSKSKKLGYNRNTLCSCILLIASLLFSLRSAYDHRCKEKENNKVVYIKSSKRREKHAAKK
jgi:hypothetical protein